MKGFRLLTRFVARPEPTDEQLMWRVGTAEDHAAFAELMARWRGRIRDLCGRWLGDVALGEDVTQNVFTRIFERRREYRPTGRFSTWLWRVALNLCRDEHRRRSARPGWPATVEADPPENRGEAELLARVPSAEPSPDAQAARHEEGELVRAAVLRLPESLRTVIVLRHYQDLKLREIAEVLEIPEGTVNSRMADALVRLARELAPNLRPAAMPDANRILPLSSPEGLTP